jgi:CBS domain-containing protein
MRQTEFLATACDPKTLTVGQLMQDAVFTCGSRTDALTISRLMTHRNFGSLPIVEEDRTLVGLVSEYDLLQAMIDGRDLRKIMAVEMMSTHPVTATENMKLEEVANLLKLEKGCEL